MDARQVDLRSRDRIISGIRREESRSRSQRSAIARADLRKMSEIAASNQKLAVKLYTKKPTYQVLDLEKDY